MKSLAAGVAVSDLKAPCYDREHALRAWWRLSDTLRTPTGERYAFGQDGDGDDVIPATNRENDTPERLAMLNPGLANDPAVSSALAARKGIRRTVDQRRALCRPIAYVRKIADHFTSHVMRRPASVTGDGAERWAEWSADVDGRGTSLQRLLTMAMRAGLVDACSGVLADWSGSAPKSEADLDASRVVARLIDADQVISVDRSSTGGVIAALLLMSDAAGPFLWRVDAATAQRANLDPAGKSITGVGDPQPHGFGRCPLYLLDEFPTIIPGVAEGQKAIARTDSLLRHRCHEDAIPWQIITGTQNAQAVKTAILAGPMVTALEDPQARAFVVGPDVGVAESLRKTMQQDEDQLYEDAKVQPVQATGSPESGVAKAYRFVDADVELARCAEVVEAAERHLAACVFSQLSWGDPPTINRGRTFAPLDRTAVLVRTEQVAASNLPDPIKVREYQAAAAELYPGDAEVQAELADTPPPAGMT